MHLISIFHKKQNSLQVTDLYKQSPSNDIEPSISRQEQLYHSHPNKVLPNVMSLPNLKAKTKKSPMTNDVKEMTSEYNSQHILKSPTINSRKLKKSRSFNFLSKYLKKPKEVKISKPYNNHASNESFDDIIRNYEEMMIPILQKTFLHELFDKKLQYNLKLAHDRTQSEKPNLASNEIEIENIKLSDIPHSTEIKLENTGENLTSREVLIQTQQETDYDPQNPTNDSLMNHYSVLSGANLNINRLDKKSLQRSSVISTSSNFLDDLSSIILVPRTSSIYGQEKQPLMNDFSYSTNEMLAETTDTESRRLSAQRLSMPPNKNKYPGRYSQLGKIQEDSISKNDIIDIRKDVSTPMDKVKEGVSLTDLNSVGTPNTTELHNLEAVTFDEAISHSTSKNNSSAQLSSELTDKTSICGTKFETFKDVQYESIKNYSHVNIISPEPISINESSRIKELKKRLANLLKSTEDEELETERPSNPIATLTKDEVYRNEMLSLIETHSSMVNKKQIEINHLKDLLLKERVKNNLLSSPQIKDNLLPSPRFSHNMKASPMIPDEVHSLSPNAENKGKIRKQFIPINITITEDSKPKNYIPISKNPESMLLPPFDITKASLSSCSSPSSSAYSGYREPTTQDTENTYGLKPFHKFKVTSPKVADPMIYSSPASNEYHSTFKDLNGLGIYNPRMSTSSDDSSIYYSAQDLSFDETEVDQQKNHNQNTILNLDSQQYLQDYCSDLGGDVLFRDTANERREISGSTIASSLMSKNLGRSNDTIMNTSLTSCITTPDSIEFK